MVVSNSAAGLMDYEMMKLFLIVKTKALFIWSRVSETTLPTEATLSSVY